MACLFPRRFCKLYCTLSLKQKEGKPTHVSLPSFSAIESTTPGHTFLARGPRQRYNTLDFPESRVPTGRRSPLLETQSQRGRRPHWMPLPKRLRLFGITRRMDIGSVYPALESET